MSTASVSPSTLAAEAKSKGAKVHRKWTDDKLAQLWTQCLKDVALFESSLGLDPKEVLVK